jgi:hypothetical protein
MDSHKGLIQTRHPAVTQSPPKDIPFPPQPPPPPVRMSPPMDSQGQTGPKGGPSKYMVQLLKPIPVE